MAQRSMDTIKNTIAKIDSAFVRNVIVFVVQKIVGGVPPPVLYNSVNVKVSLPLPCSAFSLNSQLR